MQTPENMKTTPHSSTLYNGSSPSPLLIYNPFLFQHIPVAIVLLLLIVGWWGTSLHLLILSIKGTLSIVEVGRGKAAPLLIAWKEAPLVFWAELTLILIVVLRKTTLSRATGIPTALIGAIGVSAALTCVLSGAVVALEGSLCNLINSVDSAASHDSCLDETHFENVICRVGSREGSLYGGSAESRDCLPR
jgi:hypothetical protein